MWWNVFRHRAELLEYGRGMYLDVGASNPTMASNTLFFDKCLGWTGVCFEPNTKYQRDYSKTRSCHLVPHCVLGTATRVVLTSGGTPQTRHMTRARQNDTNAVDCVVVSAVLAQLGLANRPVDLLSVDIEGVEASVLRCWPFELLPVRAILLETNHPKNARERPAINRFFHRHGYANVQSFATALRGKAAVWTDDLFVRQEHPVVFPRLASNSKDTRAGILPGGTHRRCPEELAHMGWWCMEFLAWEPESKLWGRCEQASNGTTMTRRRT